MEIGDNLIKANELLSKRMDILSERLDLLQKEINDLVAYISFNEIKDNELKLSVNKLKLMNN